MICEHQQTILVVASFVPDGVLASYRRLDQFAEPTLAVKYPREIEDVRQQVAHFAQLVPRPPRGTEVVVVDAGGVKAERIVGNVETTRRVARKRVASRPKAVASG